MAIRVAINGYGRIGRNILRARYESKPLMKSRSLPSTIPAAQKLTPI
jgi:glyceraldehyde-3-phosphate dehydrogenase/erythrose-4-phosphate dehydrogenase